MSFRSLSSATALVALLSTFASPVAISASQEEIVAEGKRVAFHRKLGNCLTCHMIPGGDSPGNVGPPLVAMKARFPDKAKLRAQIWDSTKANPATLMPPFGKHSILTDEQVDAVVEFIYTL